MSMNSLSKKPSLIDKSGFLLLNIDLPLRSEVMLLLQNELIIKSLVESFFFNDNKIKPRKRYHIFTGFEGFEGNLYMKININSHFYFH